MPSTSFASPVLEGKDAHAIAIHFREHMDDYEESRKQHGMTMERAYLQPTPMGSFVVAYIESGPDFADLTKELVTSEHPIDKFFIQNLAEIHGVDLTQPPPGPPPEYIGGWSDPDVHTRKKGLAFTAPLQPGKTDLGRAFVKEYSEARASEHAESRRAKGISKELVFLNSTPHGDVVCVYLEGDDPQDGNRQFAESKSDYDVWFKDECKKFFDANIDFNVPLPQIETVWDWARTPVPA
jgi:hypothetical protein